jgi:hypothetical protein
MSLCSSLRNVGSPPVEGHLPGFDGATGWLNSPPLTDSPIALDGNYAVRRMRRRPEPADGTLGRPRR